jgi:hypothetical protein
MTAAGLLPVRREPENQVVSAPFCCQTGIVLTLPVQPYAGKISLWVNVSASAGSLWIFS